ncbi:MAG: AraC family transcriptional regulator [Acutalibacteraceae bacterium]|nr:AraC family transcriptional regulator [Acutalibacteraceae bacterium]
MNRLKDFAVTEICCVYTPTYYEKEVLSMSKRQWYGLSLAIDGEIAYTHKGKTYISDKNHMIFLPENAEYELNCYRPGSFTLVNFKCAPSFKCDEFIQIPISAPEGFISMHKLMTKLFLFKTQGSHFELMSLLYAMIGRLHTDAAKHTAFPVIKSGVKYMEDNISNPNLSNKDMANAAGLSEIYFRKLFKLSFGTSPHNYMQQIRINKAKIMLENGINSIDDIYSACGYNNIYYFFKVFKEKTGYTPTEYREKYYRKNL